MKKFSNSKINNNVYKNNYLETTHKGLAKYFIILTIKF